MVSSIGGGQSRSADDDDYDAIFLRLLEDEESYDRQRNVHSAALGDPRALGTFARVTHNSAALVEGTADRRSDTGGLAQTSSRVRDATNVFLDGDSGAREHPPNAAVPWVSSMRDAVPSPRNETALPEWIRREIYVRDGELKILRDQLERQQRELISLRNARAAASGESRRLLRAQSTLRDAFTGHGVSQGSAADEVACESHRVYVERLTAEVERLRARLAFREREVAQMRELLVVSVSPAKSRPKTTHDETRKASVSQVITTTPARSGTKRAGLFFQEHLLLLHEQRDEKLQQTPASVSRPDSNVNASAASIANDTQRGPKDFDLSQKRLSSERDPLPDTIDSRHRAAIVAVLAASADSWQELFQRWSADNDDQSSARLDSVFSQQAVMLLNANLDLRLCLAPIQHAMLMCFVNWKQSPDATSSVSQDSLFSKALTVLDALIEHSEVIRSYFVHLCSDRDETLPETYSLMLEHVMEMMITRDSWVVGRRQSTVAMAFFRILRNLFQTWCALLSDGTVQRGPSTTVHAKMVELIRSPRLFRLLERHPSPGELSLIEMACAALSSAFALENCFGICPVERVCDTRQPSWLREAVLAGLPARVLNFLRHMPLRQVCATLSLLGPLFLGPHADFVRQQWVLHSSQDDRARVFEDLVVTLERLLMQLQGFSSLVTELPIHLLDLDRGELSFEARAHPRVLAKTLMHWRIVETLLTSTKIGPSTSLSPPLPDALYPMTVRGIHECVIGCLTILYQWTRSSSTAHPLTTSTAGSIICIDKENRASTSSPREHDLKESFGKERLFCPGALRPALRARLRALLRSLRQELHLMQRRSATTKSTDPQITTQRVVLDVGGHASALAPLVRELWRWLHPQLDAARLVTRSEQDAREQTGDSMPMASSI